MGDEEFWMDDDFWEAPDMWGEGVVDFHETQKAAPYMWMLGRIVLDFNYVEHQLNTLLWAYGADSFEAGHSLTTQLGSRSVCELILSFSKAKETDSEVLALVEFATKAFEICRVNRNMIVHSMTIEDTGGPEVLWIRPSRKTETQYAHLLLSGQEMNRVSTEIAETARFILPLQIRRHMLNSKAKEAVLPDLPELFQMPEKLRSDEINISDHLASKGVQKP